MALDVNINTREFQKFCLNSENLTAVRTCTEINGGNITINSPKSRRVTTMQVGDTEVKVPTTPYTNRISISIANLSETDTLYLGNTGVTADRTLGTNAGWEIGPEESFNENIDPSDDIYCIAPTGKTILIKVMETSKT